jgi:hypothetical protein
MRFCLSYQWAFMLLPNKILLSPGTFKMFNRIASILKCSVGVSFVRLCEPCATLALWLGWMQHYYGTWTLTMITQSSKIRHIERLPSSKLHQFSKMASILKGCEGVTIHISAMLVLFCGITCIPCNLGFEAWLDAQLLQYRKQALWKGMRGLQLSSVQGWC